MPKTSKETASQVEVVEGILEDRSEDLDGYNVVFTTYLAEMDHAPLFRGLPDDRCQCPHRKGFWLIPDRTHPWCDYSDEHDSLRWCTSQPGKSERPHPVSDLIISIPQGQSRFVGLVASVAG